MVPAGHLERVELERAEALDDPHHRRRLGRQGARRREEVATDEEAARGGAVEPDRGGHRPMVRGTAGCCQVPAARRGPSAESDVSSRPNGSVPPKHQPQPKELTAITAPPAPRVVDEVIAGYEALMQLLADSHAPEFLEIDITMPQAKVLYLLGGRRRAPHVRARRPARRVAVHRERPRRSRRRPRARRRAATTRPTAARWSWRLTPAGAAFIDRFRELNARQMRDLLDALDDAELDTSLPDALAALGRAAVPPPGRTRRRQRPPTPAARKDPA